MRIVDRRAARILLVMSVVACVCWPAQAASSKTAARCGVDPEQPTLKVLADVDGRGGWAEYPDMKAVPALSLGAGSTAQVWPGKEGAVLISVKQPGEDFHLFTDYCFDKAGHLVQLRYEVRTAWGWGYRMEGPIAKGKVVPELAEFFSMETDAPIKRPESAGDIPNALKPHVYRAKYLLPFFDLLSS